MSAVLIDGKLLADEIKQSVKQRVQKLKVGVPAVALILVGNDGASHVYVSNKKKACEYTGIRLISFELEEKTSEAALFDLVDELNLREDIDGILVQLPLPSHINAGRVLLRIKPEKDVEGFHPYNVGMLNIGKPLFKPCTSAGIIELIKRSGISISGKNCVVIGRSNIVGKPVASLLLAENGTVTSCHSQTHNLAGICREADVLVAAVGKKRFITAEMVKENAIVIDVGIHKLEDNQLCGDVDFESVRYTIR